MIELKIPVLVKLSLICEFLRGRKKGDPINNTGYKYHLNQK